MRVHASDFAEPVAVAVAIIIAVSLWQGMKRGAPGSAKHLLLFLWETVCTIASLALAVRFATAFGPVVESRLMDADLRPPAGEMDNWSLAWHTFITGVRDFSLLRFGLLFLIGYLVIRLLLRLLAAAALTLVAGAGSKAGALRMRAPAAAPGGALSRAAGAALGFVHGGGRALVLMAALFVYVSLLPNAPLAARIESSPLYREASDRLLEPVAGGVMAEQGPVLSRAVEAEFRRILQRRYEIIDRDVPDDIREAALRITAGAKDDEAKARALYDWVGTRIAYDWDKADAYTERGEWREQTPEDTFRTRRGVCIDIARLYAVMARSAGLEARVVTGLGADGRGGFGPHAWNEVRAGEQWIPLDATWATSGDWFNPPDFDRTHVRET
ncbi:transglutaminase-like enzyme, predicted cysteine protease [Thermobacillus composti KWC4]|uniref:Transglutaminase-like enzyme, predicted cysteine protease n=1 Tax=Thermobacillus composti (strain DSM 18247 / JCM 13945 / KWC4) TaxID=717605 RepID=L0EB60_THECK|nr:transglutaminase-like domain-containing protein [Thermobacillus composti]AGA57047.1 transglutaminase-like enzyme, predicted cysteine protease [Thermobacillus composti KWC4]